MLRLEQRLSERFFNWEVRGRGWHVFPEPVSPEPPFRPFAGHALPRGPSIDDGRRPTVLSSFVQKLSRNLSAETATPAPAPEPEKDEPSPLTLTRSPPVELRASLPGKLDIPREAFEQFVTSLSLCNEPVSFEIVGVPGRISLQFAISTSDAPLVRRQLQAYFPEAVFQTSENTLQELWETSETDEALIVEFGLGREFMYPLACGKLDPFIGIVGALSELQPHELGIFQVLFEPTRHPWDESVYRSVHHADGRPFFVNSPELSDAAKQKIARPLYAVVVRMLVASQTHDRTLQIARDVAGSLRVFTKPQGNELIPLANDEYRNDQHLEDALRRQTRRSGMILNLDELIGFVHIPSSAVRSDSFARETRKSKPAPSVTRGLRGVILGENRHAGETVQVRLLPEQRVRHSHIIGASGTGKSTLLYNLILQDIENGDGLAVLDPHGDLIDRILGVIPAHRVDDVVLVDPSDEEYSVGFNILSAHSDLEKNLLASDLVSVFERLATSWGDQMGSVLHNAILAFLESSRKCTLADLRRFLIEPAFRTEFLKSVSDPAILYYWQKGFPQLSGNKSIGSVITRLETFLAPKPIRYMVSQTENRLDFAHIMDTGKIFLAKLSQGLLGKENSYLLGTLLISKFQQLAMARQSQALGSRRQFWCYIDEFHNFITPSMAEILAGARKYGIGLILAHQEIRQLHRDSEVASAVMSNPYTRVCFRVGDDDARKLSEGFSFFEARDLQNLGVGEAIARVERSTFDFNLLVPWPQETDPGGARTRRAQAIAASRARYGTPRSAVESRLRELWETESTPKEPPVRKSRAAQVTQTAPPAHRESERQAATERESLVATRPPPATLGVHAASTPELPLPPPPLPAPVTPVAPPENAVPPKAKPAMSGDLGRGGAQHKAIQHRIKESAEPLGFRAIIEKEILEGQGSIDLLLDRPGQTIACEISITTTVDHEVGNVAKCLKAGFASVAVICLEEERLEKISAAVRGSLGAAATGHVDYFHPDGFIAHLHALKPVAPASPNTEVIRKGYRVKRAVSKLSREEEREREAAAIRSIAESMRRRD